MNESKSPYIYCSACGENAMEVLLFGILRDMGCRGSDPNYCPATEGYKHIWTEMVV